MRRYGFAVLVVALALGVRWALQGILEETAPFLVFVVAVLLAARSGGFGLGLIATGLSGLAATYFFLPPIGSLIPSRPADTLQLALFIGIGIAPEHQERIFGVFERLHGVESYPGTGVGLAIVRKGLERMGGQAGVQSAPGAGSRFWIELPRAEGGA